MEVITLSKYIHKVVVKAMKLEHIYQTNLTYDGFKIFKQLPKDIAHKNFYKNFKFLYLYEKYKEENRFTPAYQQLVQECYQELEQTLSNTIKRLVPEAVFYDKSLNQFISSRVSPLYFNKYAIYPITSVSHLPLKLRLYVYYALYQIETNEEAKCHLRNRLSVTLARLNEVEFASYLALYNWVVAQQTSSHFAKTRVVQSALHAVTRHDEKYRHRNFEKEVHLKQPMAEIYRCYEKLMTSNQATYSKDNVMCLDLLATYYVEYEQLRVISEILKAYLRTKDTKELNLNLSNARMDLIKASIHLPTHQTEYIMPEVIRLQLQLYDRLIELMV